MSLVGREEELSRLRELVAPPYAKGRVLLLSGDPGAGKTALLAQAAGNPLALIELAKMIAADPDAARRWEPGRSR